MKRTPLQLNRSEWPGELADRLADAAIYDSSCSPEARVVYIDKGEGFFLKKAAEDALKTEARMTEYFHSLRLSAEVLYYGAFEGFDYLLTRRVPGEDCTDPRYLAHPKRLCDTTAALLRALHETDAKDCPVPDRVQTYTDSVKRGFDGHAYESDLFRGLWEFGSFEEAKRTAEEGMPRLKKDVLLHGDYCLPNIILDDWKLSGYIDLGSGGIGDRHIDVAWGIWTLNFNLGTTEYMDRFLDAYGRDVIDPEMLRAVAAMEMIGG
ncbi:MAG: aminoglycoside 3'-phosphotransferase [Firmicutes bacterium]|nr:aminoglycoside 3'-phosphotransferase [Bacillota bacterium]